MLFRSVMHAIDGQAPASGVYIYPPACDTGAASTPEEVKSLEAARADLMRKGPLMMLIFTKGGQDPDDPRMFVRGLLIELFATAMLAAAIAMAGSAHGRLRRFLALLAMVAFMTLATHGVAWAFMGTPGEWARVVVFDSAVGWTLAGLPAVFLLRAMRDGDATAA